eukprot:3858224-Rhodomonas_salina.1
MQNAAREQAHEKAHVLNDISIGCPYPGCRDKNHVLAKCLIKAEDLCLHSEAQKLKAGSKGKKGFEKKSCKDGKKEVPVCGYKPCWKRGHQGKDFWKKAADQKAAAGQAKPEAATAKKPGSAKSAMVMHHAEAEDSGGESLSHEAEMLAMMAIKAVIPDHDASHTGSHCVLVDSGTTSHLSNDRSKMFNIK